MKELLMKIDCRMMAIHQRVKGAFVCQKGENYVDVGVKILIAVVIGALLLAGLYELFGDVVLPTLEKKITDMFNYAG